MNSQAFPGEISKARTIMDMNMVSSDPTWKLNKYLMSITIGMRV